MPIDIVSLDFGNYLKLFLGYPTGRHRFLSNAFGNVNCGKSV